MNYAIILDDETDKVLAADIKGFNVLQRQAK